MEEKNDEHKKEEEETFHERSFTFYLFHVPSTC